VAVQATGHGAVPIGADTILVHTSGLSGCVVDVSGRSARVGAGATWQQVLDAATPYGLAPLCGSAPGVGVVGYLTGGGIGPLARSVGLSADHVRAFDLVTGSGEVLHVTPDEHGDLSWGVRGGREGEKGCARVSTRLSHCSSCRRCPAYRKRWPVA
jgi:FAD/FMN-containing dehydrogenase